MNNCCNNDDTAIALQQKQRGTLHAVLAINAVMFVVIAIAAWVGDSSALLADSLDNLGDALTYGLSLYAVSRGQTIKARVAMFKGVLIVLAATVVAARIIYRLYFPSVPVFEVMGIFSLLGLSANGICLMLLWRHRQEDINMSSVWECSRNDIASNMAVLITAAGIWLTGSYWPDLVVASVLVLLLLRSGASVIRSALQELRSVAH